MSRDRRQLEQLIKSWAQSHTSTHIIADPASSDEGITNTSGFFTWIVQNKSINIDLLSLVDRLELFILNRNRRKFDGMFCKKCNNFYEFADANQKDGSLVCYSCRSNPYI
jgi:hypothetical protein